MPGKLYQWQWDNIALPEAIRACADVLGGAFALLYTPSWCRVAYFAGGTLELMAGNGERQELTPDGLSEVYEARLFNQTAELRWLHKLAGYGVSVLLSEDPSVGVNGSSGRSPTCFMDYMDSQYLLWGTVDRMVPSDRSATWACLYTARIGTLWVPLEGETSWHHRKSRVVLNAREYFGTFEDGNAGVVAERLRGLGVRNDG